MRHKKTGFTLIELIVAITVISIIAGLAVANISQNRVRARDVSRKQAVSALSISLEQRKSSEKTYFVQMPGSSDPCVVSHVGGAQFLQATNAGNTRCVGFQGGGGGRMNAVSSGVADASYPNGSKSINDALYDAGYLAKIPLDPLVTGFSQARTGRDFLLVLCTKEGNIPQTAETALNYSVYAQLEAPADRTTGEVNSFEHGCGGSGSTTAFDLSIY